MDIVPGEWQKLEMQCRLKKGREYRITFWVEECETAPYILTAESTLFPGDIQKEESPAALMAFSYGRERERLSVIWIVMILILCLLNIVFEKSVIWKKKIINIWELEITVADLFFCISLMAVFCILHIDRISEVPAGINIDELGGGYDAWCILHFGTDRAGNMLPVYLLNYGHGSSVLYCYCMVPFVKLFGLSVTVMRMPAILFSFVLLISGIRLASITRKGDKKAVLLFMVFIITMPFFVYYARMGLDCNLFLSMMTAFAVCFLNAVEKANTKLFLIAGIVGGITLYTYALSWIVMPFVLLCVMVYLLWIGKISVRSLLWMGIPMFVLAIPLLLFNMINIFGWKTVRLGFFTIPKITNYRNKFGFFDLKKRMTWALRAVTIDGGDIYLHYRPLYWIILPFLVIGLWWSYTRIIDAFKKRQWCADILMTAWFLAECFVAAYTLVFPVAYQLNGIFIPLVWFAWNGVLFVFRKKWNGKQVILGVVVSIYVMSVGSFINDYFSDKRMPRLYYHDLKSAISYVESIDKTSEKALYIYANDGWWIHSFYYSAKKMDPSLFNKSETMRFTYDHVSFDYPKQIDHQGIYIIAHEYTDKVIELYQAGAVLVTDVGNYFVVEF